MARMIECKVNSPKLGAEKVEGEIKAVVNVHDDGAAILSSGVSEDYI